MNDGQVLALRRAGLDCLDDRAVHAVGDLVRERDVDLVEAGRPEARLVLAFRERSGDAPTKLPRSARSAEESRSSATTSLIPILPPGFSTRAISVNTAGLSVERLITQLEITTSTDSAGSGIASMTPFRKIAFRVPASWAFRRASASISSVMSRP
jgi:hypothetical protein